MVMGQFKIDSIYIVPKIEPYQLCINLLNLNKLNIAKIIHSTYSSHTIVISL